MSITIEDSLFLFGRKKNDNLSKNLREAEIKGQNDWLEGKDASDNPYKSHPNTTYYQTWYKAWLNMNKNA